WGHDIFKKVYTDWLQQPNSTTYSRRILSSIKTILVSVLTACIRVCVCVCVCVRACACACGYASPESLHSVQRGAAVCVWVYLRVLLLQNTEKSRCLAYENVNVIAVLM